jgi:competence protein ComEA
MNRLIVVLLALVVTLPAFVKSRLVVKKTTRTAFFAGTSSGIIVRIGGDVRHPGVYSLAANNMTIGAIALAEPVWSRVRVLPERCGPLRLVSGSTVLVTRNSDDSLAITVGSMATAERLILGLPLDINSMDAADFDRLPGIGPVLAARIVAFRQYNGGKMRPEELVSVKGIGYKKYVVLKKSFN